MAKLPVKIFYGYLIALVLAAGIFALPASAQTTVTCVCGDGTSATSNTSANCPQACAGHNGSGTGTGTTTPTGTGTPASSLTNPISFCGASTTGQACVQLLIGNVIKTALGIVGSIALLMMTWGGFRWLTAMGNSERVEKGKDTLVWATLGLIVIFGAYAITDYIISHLAAGK